MKAKLLSSKRKVGSHLKMKLSWSKTKPSMNLVKKKKMQITNGNFRSIRQSLKENLKSRGKLASQDRQRN